jgi:hypothetical protein
MVRRCTGGRPHRPAQTSPDDGETEPNARRPPAYQQGNPYIPDELIVMGMLSVCRLFA